MSESSIILQLYDIRKIHSVEKNMKISSVKSSKKSPSGTGVIRRFDTFIITFERSFSNQFLAKTVNNLFTVENLLETRCMMNMQKKIIFLY